MKLKAFILSLVILTGSFLNPAYSHLASKPPTVVVSITPFYALVAAVMEGVGTPVLLVKPGASPHEYSLKPSDIQWLNKADIIFWAGHNLESFLIKPLKNLNVQASSSKKIITFSKTKGLLLLPQRHSPAWDPHIHTAKDTPEADPHLHNVDMHFWLDPVNAVVLTRIIARTLSQIDPLNAPFYKKNAGQLKKRLKALDTQLKDKLKNVEDVPFIVFHDAYQYFEQRYHLRGVGSITLNPEIPPSAKRLNIIRATIQQKKVRCIFTEPQFQAKLVQNIVKDLNVNTGALDPIGQSIHNSPVGYFKLLEDLSETIKGCLTQAPRA